MIRRALPALCAALTALALGLGAGPAAAAEPLNHPFVSSFPLNGIGVAAPFEDACGVAVDSVGDLYVSDYYRHTIDVYNPSGTSLITKIAKEDPVDGPCGLAVGAGGVLYVNNYHRNVVKFTPSSYPFSGTVSYDAGTVIDSSHSTGVTVDPATDRVYVDDRTEIAIYEAPVLAGEEPVQRIELGSGADAYGIAVSDFPASAGDVYVADATSGTVKVYDPAAVNPDDPVGEIDGAGTPQGGFNSLLDASLAVDNSNGHLFVADNTQPGFEHPAAVIDEFTAAGAYRGQLPHGIVDAEPPGLAVDAGGDVFVTSGNDAGAVLYQFGPAAPGHLLQVTKLGTGEGTVKSAPAGIACGKACAAEYEVGAAVTLTASAAAGSTFVGWTGCASVSGAQCTVTMGVDHLVEAEFEELPPAPLALEAPAAVSQASALAPAATSAAASSPAPAAKRHRHHRKARHHRPAKSRGN